MCDEWMDGLQLPLTIEQFHRLPRNPAFKYEYLDGTAYLSPRPKYFHAMLDLAPLAEQPLPNAAAVALRPVPHMPTKIRTLRLPGTPIATARCPLRKPGSI